MDRRQFTKSMAMAGAMAPLAAPSMFAEQKSAKRRPNIVLMICDDLGSGDLHCYGSSLKTPNLDRLATEGVRFTRFNTAHPICSASRAALLTGRYSSRTHSEGAYGPDSPTGIDLDEKTLADILKPAGYRSMCIGKWHLGYPPPYLPTNRGFDSYLGVPWSVDMNPLPLIRDTTNIEPNANRDLLTQTYTKEALKFIDSAKKEPFFLYLAYSYPHDPPRSSPQFRGHSGLGHQGDAIEEIDWSAGEVLRKLQQEGLDRDTLVIFTSDHGPWFQGNPGYRRGRKATTFEGGERIPFIARWPGVIPEGRVIKEWGSNLDVVPTVAAFCGASLPHRQYDGLDIRSLLTGEKTTLDRPTMLYFAVSPKQQLIECARKGSWKLRIAQGTGEIYVNDWLFGSCGRQYHLLLPRPELYNLDRDPQESYDAAIDHPEVVEEISRDIDRMIPDFPDNVVKAYAELKAHPGSSLTPPGAAAHLDDINPPSWIWIPHSRRASLQKKS